MKTPRVYIIFLFFLLAKSIAVCGQNTTSLSYDTIIADLKKKGEEYEIAAKAGNKDAIQECGLVYLEIGLLYWDHCIFYDNSVIKDEYYGRGMIDINTNKKRRDFALPYIYKAAHYGIADAQFIAGDFLFTHAIDIYKGQYQSGTTEYNTAIAKAKTDGINYLKQASSQNHLDAANRLGQIGFEHPDQYISKVQAYNYDLLVTKQTNKHPDAFYRIGCYLESGLDTMRIDMNTAVEYYKLATNLGDYKAAKRLAQIYRTGKGDVIKNYELSQEYEDFAKQNDVPVSKIERLFVILFNLLILCFLYYVGIKFSNFYKSKLEKLFQNTSKKELLSNKQNMLIQVITYILSFLTLVGGFIIFYEFIIHSSGTSFDNNDLPELLHFLNPFRGL